VSCHTVRPNDPNSPSPFLNGAHIDEVTLFLSVIVPPFCSLAWSYFWTSTKLFLIYYRSFFLRGSVAVVVLVPSISFPSPWLSFSCRPLLFFLYYGVFLNLVDLFFVRRCCSCLETLLLFWSPVLAVSHRPVVLPLFCLSFDGDCSGSPPWELTSARCRLPPHAFFCPTIP